MYGIGTPDGKSDVGHVAHHVSMSEPLLVEKNDLAAASRLRFTTLRPDPPRSAQTAVTFAYIVSFLFITLCPRCAQALSSALEVPMEVFSASSPLLLLGENYEGAPLRLTYHEHYYALGAHYNSVVPA